MGHDTIAILGIPIDNLTMEETVERIFAMIEAYANDGRPRQVATVNVDFVVNTLSWRLSRIRHPELLDILRRADLVTADGMPIVWTSKLLRTPLKERVTGADLVPRLAEEAAKRQKSIYFLGGLGDVGKQAAELLKDRYPGLRIAGAYSPFVSTEGEKLIWAEDEDRSIIEGINRSSADILLIGFGNPKQEIWFDRNRTRLKVPVSIGIGGTYEFIVGSVARAPKWMQKTGLEFVFRITQDPRRLLQRYFVGFFKFGLMIWPAILYYWHRKLLYKLLNRKDSLQRIKTSVPSVSTWCNIKMIKLPHRLDAGFLDRFKDQTEKAINKSPNVVLDFSKTSFIDSSGLGFLIRIWRKTEKDKTSLYMIKINPSVKHFLKLNRLWDLFQEKICENLDAVLGLLKEKEFLPSFYFVTEAEPNAIFMRLFGRLDAAQMSSLDFESILTDIGKRNCVLDLKKLSFVDSTGLAFFLKIQRYLATCNKDFLICELNGNVRQLFRITKLINLFKIVPNISSAKKILEKLR